MTETQAGEERLKRWRLVLGEAAEQTLPALLGEDQNLDRVLGQLYETERSGDLGGSAPGVARWLGDIRTYFPTSVVRVMQRDALERLGLKQLLLEPELLAEVEPDIHLVATLISLSRVIPARTRETARFVVRQVVDDIERRLAEPLRQAVHGALSRSLRNTRPLLDHSETAAREAGDVLTAAKRIWPLSDSFKESSDGMLPIDSFEAQGKGRSR